jgi:hypothetical protein
MSEVAPFMSFGGNQGVVGGRRRTRRSRGLKTKTLRRMCKQKGLKTTGKKATLMKRLHMRGGAEGGMEGGVPEASPPPPPPPEPTLAPEGGRRRRRRSRRREE